MSKNDNNEIIVTDKVSMNMLFESLKKLEIVLFENTTLTKAIHYCPFYSDPYLFYINQQLIVASNSLDDILSLYNDAV